MGTGNGEKKWLKNTLWGIIATLVLSSFAFTAWAFNRVGEEVIANERINIQCHTDIKTEFTQEIKGLTDKYLIPMSREISTINAKLP